MNRILSLRSKLGLICLLIISMQTSIINCGEEGQNKKRRTGDIGLADGAGAGAGIMLLAEIATAGKIEPSALCGAGAGGAGLPVHRARYLPGAGARNTRKLFGKKRGALAHFLKKNFGLTQFNTDGTRNQYFCNLGTCVNCKINGGAIPVRCHLTQFHSAKYKEITEKYRDFDEHCDEIKETSKTADAARRAAKKAAK